jgi:amidase
MPIGALHGVPVTTKENVDQEGCATVNGVAAYRDVVASADSPVVAN